MEEVKYLLDCIRGRNTFSEGKIKNIDLLELYDFLNQKIIEIEDCLDYCNQEIEDYRNQCKEHEEQVKELKEAYNSGDTAKFEELLDEISEMDE